MKQIKNKFGILAESHGQDRKHKEEITIFKNPGKNQQRNKEKTILEVLGQALRKQKTCKTKQNNISELFLESPQMPRPRKNQKNKNNISELFLSHPKFQDLEKTKKKQYFRILSEDTPKSKTSKKPKKTKKIKYFRTLSEDTPKSKTSGKLFFFVFFGFLQVFVKRLEILFFFVFFGFLQVFVKRLEILFFLFFLIFCRIFGFLPEGLSQDLQNIAFFISYWFSAGMFQFSFSRCPLLVLWRAFGSIELAEYVWANIFKKYIFT